MAVLDTLDEVKAYLEGVKKKYRFKKARMAQQDAAELQATLAKCRGKLEICRKDFNRTINTQSHNISKGIAEGADTAIQEQILWDAAIGYMLVKDAIFALETINSYDSVSHAYEMLDAAMKQIAGKKNGFPKSMKIGSTKERNAYGYITSSAALKDKEELLDTFFESLKLSGDIEAELAGARNPAARQAELRHAYTSAAASAKLEGKENASEMDEIMERLNGAPGKASETDDIDASLLDIHPPVDAL